MTRDTLFIVRGERFESQAAIERRVKQELAGMPLNQRTVNPFLQSVVNNYHPSFITAGMCSTGEFEYLDFSEQRRRGMDTAERYRGGKVMTTRVLPLGEWRDCTVYPWRKHIKPEGDITDALRQKAGFFLPHPEPGDRCAVVGCPRRGGDLEYNHVRPTFKEIADECLRLVTPRERETLFGYSKFVTAHDELVHCIPDTHPAVIRLRELHQANEWEWLCAFHHRNVQELAPAAVAMPLWE